MPTLQWSTTMPEPRMFETDLNRKVRERKKSDNPEDKPKTPKKAELVYGYRNQSKSKEVG